MYKKSIWFSGAGHHYPWQIGVAWYLQEQYDLSQRFFIGASAVSFVASILATDISVREYVSKWIRDGHRIFKSSPTGCNFICHDVVKLVGSKYICHQMITSERTQDYLFLYHNARSVGCTIHLWVNSHRMRICTKPYALLCRFLF